MAAIATKHPGGDVAWYALSAQDVTAQMDVDADDVFRTRTYVNAGR
jgi:hypothetical protein